MSVEISVNHHTSINMDMRISQEKIDFIHLSHKLSLELRVYRRRST